MRWKYAGFSKDGNGKVISGATIKVFLAGTTTAASIYTTVASTTAVNSTTSSADGSFAFYVDAFDYDNEQTFLVRIEKNGYTSKDFDNIKLDDIVLGTYTVSTNKTVTTHLNPPKGIIYSIATGVTLTITGVFDAGLYQVFSCDGTGKVVFGAGSVLEIYPQWWTANVAPGTTDMTAAFQAAAASVIATSGTVRVPAGIYKLTDTIVCMNGTAAAIRWEFDNGVELDTYLTGTTPLFSYVGAATVNQQAGIFGNPKIIAKNAGAVTARNSGVAALVQGAIGIQLNYYAKDMTHALHLHNSAANTYTEQVKFNIWSEYCQEAIKFEVTSGTNSFHGCGGFLYADIWAGQVGINIGSGCYWYNFDLRMDAVGHSTSPSTAATLVTVDGTVARGTAVFNIENQTEVSGVGTANALDMSGAQYWSAQTAVFSQGLPLTGTRAKVNGFNIEDSSLGGLSAFVSAKRSASLAADGVMTLPVLNGGILIIRDSSAGGSAVVMVDVATGATIISDPQKIIQTSDVMAPYTSTKIAFTHNSPSVDSLTSSTAAFQAGGLLSGMNITITGSTSNNKSVTVVRATTDTLLLTPSDVLVTEAEGDSVTLTYKPGFYIACPGGGVNPTITNRYATAKTIDVLVLGQ